MLYIFFCFFLFCSSGFLFNFSFVPFFWWWCVFNVGFPFLFPSSICRLHWICHTTGRWCYTLGHGQWFGSLPTLGRRLRGWEYTQTYGQNQTCQFGYVGPLEHWGDQQSGLRGGAKTKGMHAKYVKFCSRHLGKCCNISQRKGELTFLSLASIVA